jgi:hypothetical protein
MKLRQLVTMLAMGQVRPVVRRACGCGCLEDYTASERRAMWPPAQALSARHLRRCQVLEHREAMLEHMPTNAVCAEVGIWKADFSQTILSKTQPATLHLIDCAEWSIAHAARRFAGEVTRGQVRVHRGDSAEVLASMPANYFDWVYIDADHSYTAVKRDLEAVRTRMKPNGLIALNDYIYFAPSDFEKYGVIEAVNEFCLEHDFEMIFFALQPRMYNDVVIREMR